ncbi:decaprenylphospho-beta-D-erythro-pentofuranosid-2-ulose 2-reductase [Actinokineospora globicatena]|uniref:Decaprenylphospho-beta-D-erythro-pentofuranosid-2-ulose 2-reductase n=1 Tax=Actinokineospora globicatena TaxID=103729 RepID=A0A9W6QK71_9PSEU|nr:decaprenylphospho-beta-D-erythro-pentofuranosid-2-ulose 2-reductase [Actinokineospora globicatena]MCP2301100.1 decaprenylphospho-beta-D-erythro-pentofuranosid-2-ulose 2-reductase [Actinokineospora globicatena]GLW77264.1 decaprenylphospho-beta-D-erythro-pentofuranosid-2-ulose 2-reductase [Actinokineospora globicatena]GLW84098.1 decaprenylphospho-beta-D-erythro-pentofuranosid-2-ulose 2-reductase [Actinokineospora globicatena]GLW91958.1 decaprenylphospho-beta-D-erythro-pentofuranosid-2-ulose 2-
MINAVGTPQSLLLLGGTSEIGLAIAANYAKQRPLTVTLAARPSARLDAAAEQLRGLGATVRTVAFDARDFDSHPKVVAEAFGDGDIDVAVVAFGVLGDAEQLWQDHAAGVEAAQVNYTAAVSVGIALAERFGAQGHGSIIALSSVAGERVRRSNFVYGSTKAGFDGFYLGLGEALRPKGITVTVVRPGFVHTKMTEGLKAAPMATTPDKVAQIAVDAVRARRDLVWAPAPWRVVMSVLRHVPRPIFRKLPI